MRSLLVLALLFAACADDQLANPDAQLACTTNPVTCASMMEQSMMEQPEQCTYGQMMYWGCDACHDCPGGWMMGVGYWDSWASSGQIEESCPCTCNPAVPRVSLSAAVHLSPAGRSRRQ